MIYDTLNNLPNYLGVSDNLDTVIEYIMARDITTLPAGRTRIDGDKAVVTVSTVTPQTSDKALFQRHDNHITLETDLDGSELFEVSLAELTPTKPTDEAADTTVGTAGTSIAGMLCEGRFALCLHFLNFFCTLLYFSFPLYTTSHYTLSNTLNLELFDLLFSLISSSVGTTGFLVITLPFGTLPHTHAGKLGGQVQGFSLFLNLVITILSSNE